MKNFEVKFVVDFTVSRSSIGRIGARAHLVAQIPANSKEEAEIYVKDFDLSQYPEGRIEEIKSVKEL